MTFQSGQSGNPAGRPKGARGKATILAERMFDGEAEAIIRAAIDLAKAGDASAVRVCLDRVAPRPRDRAIAFELPRPSIARRTRRRRLPQSRRR